MRWPTRWPIAAVMATLGRPWANFYRIFDATKRHRKINVFCNRPKSHPELQKSLFELPRLHFWWIFQHFWWPFWHHFLMFLQNAENLDFGDSSIDFILSSLPKHLLSASFFHHFSSFFVEAFLDQFFSIFLQLLTKNVNFKPTWWPTWAPISPFGPTFPPQNPLKGESPEVRKPSRIGARMIGLRYLPSLPFLPSLETCLSLKARFSPMWDGFFMIFEDFLHDVLNSCAQIEQSVFEQTRINIFEHFPKTSTPQPHNFTNHFSKILARRYARKRLNKKIKRARWLGRVDLDTVDCCTTRRALSCSTR